MDDCQSSITIPFLILDDSLALFCPRLLFFVILFAHVLLRGMKKISLQYSVVIQSQPLDIAAA
jgi:hypothetical protein